MPFTVSNEGKSLLASGSTALKRALHIVRADGTIFAFTDCRLSQTLPAFTARGITTPGATYDHRGGMNTTDLVQSNDVEKVDNWEVTLIMGPWLTEADVRAGLFQNARYSLLIFDWRTGTIIMRRARGFVGAPRFNGDEVTFKMRSLSQALAGDYLPATSPLSRISWEGIASIVKSDNSHFFNPATDQTTDGRLAEFSTTVTSAAAGAKRICVVAATVGYPARRFDGGRVVFTNGPNSGFAAGILSWNSGTGQLTLDRKTPAPISAGASLKVRIHAPLTFEEWLEYFGTGKYFAGEPQIVTIERANQVNED
jgi:hypothetical protein